MYLAGYVGLKIPLWTTVRSACMYLCVILSSLAMHGSVATVGVIYDPNRVYIRPESNIFGPITQGAAERQIFVLKAISTINDDLSYRQIFNCKNFKQILSLFIEISTYF